MIAQEEESMTEIVPQEPRTPALKLTAAEIRADVQLIQQVLHAVMKKDVHYGIIPGTPKPTLYKPGAEKILMTFKLNANPEVEDLSNSDEIRYRVRVKVTHQLTGNEIGWGVGECSSHETKYKWVSPVCDQEFDETPEDKRRLKWSKKKDGSVYQKKQIRPNLQDTANTILKMAKKRALVDAALTCTGASDVFDQDIEDLPENLRQNMAETKPMPPMPQRTSEKAAPEPQDGPDYDSTDDPAPPPAKKKVHLDMNVARKMKAKFDAPCKCCGVIVKKDADMVYMPEGVDKGGYHSTCVQG